MDLPFKDLILPIYSENSLPAKLSQAIDAMLEPYEDVRAKLPVMLYNVLDRQLSVHIKAELEVVRGPQ